MSLSLGDFDAFFAAINAGARPFSWQRRLLEYILTTGSWPDVIDAPTGAGKSSVVEVHVFANAVAAVRKDESARSVARPPRRLVATVNRRALVDSHAERARRVAQALESPEREPVLQEVANALLSLRACEKDAAVQPLVVAKLRGGQRPDRAWVDAPSACQVIAGTPDMIGSRLLFHGYGSSRFARPREAGLLAFDTAIVVDEAHLNRQLLVTARRVHQLVQSEAGRIRTRPVQVCAMTATQSDGGEVSVGVHANDLEGPASDQTLRDRLTRPKPLTLVPTREWPGKGKPSKALAQVIADQVTKSLELRAGTVGCVVNTPELALAVADRLGGSTVRRPHDSHDSDDEGERVPRVITLVGRMRAVELDALRTEHRSLFTLEGDSEVDVVVATQTIEVGVDLDFTSLVTELAPGSAIAQRAGRVNRAGRRPSGPIVVVTPAAALADDAHSGPYGAEELRESLEWLERRAQSLDGLSSWAIHRSGQGDPPPRAQQRRAVFHRPEVWDVKEWGRTSDDLAA
ncbi:MAG: type I-U CRISPR-associated helicase/endonuclease Cas3, partial [Bifidobacteriaceae bacterium]|nr:type I-U CRISPR-associated helicase/endonuclease Cas3 [Bifidobacteriaceae bacterium]